MTAVSFSVPELDSCQTSRRPTTPSSTWVLPDVSSISRTRELLLPPLRAIHALNALSAHCLECARCRGAISCLTLPNVLCIGTASGMAHSGAPSGPPGYPGSYLGMPSNYATYASLMASAVPTAGDTSKLMMAPQLNFQTSDASSETYSVAPSSLSAFDVSLPANLSAMLVGERKRIQQERRRVSELVAF